MRKEATGNTLKVRAIAGTYVVLLAWDLVEAEPALDDLLGFAVERTELNKNGQAIEQYWMRSIKRFKDKDVGLPAGALVSTAEHPIQSFQWADYTAKAGHIYRYRIVPTYGTSKLLELREDEGVEVDIKTEPEVGVSSGDLPQHDIYFNRGVIGSQAYARDMFNVMPDVDDPASREMVWLSRGLFEGLIAFIARAKSGYSLRAAFYEFKYQPVANAFAQAVEAGADVSIVYDGESSYKVENLETIQQAGLDHVVIPRTVSEGIRHNKFIVLLKNNKPIAVWTGSTNISASGIFGHSNVGHVIWGKDIAKQYLEYWQRLADNLTPGKLREPNRKATPTPAKKTPKKSVVPLFSPRDTKADETNTLEWYAARMAEAKKLVCFAVAFDLDETFLKVIRKENDVLRYIVKDDPLKPNEDIGRDRDVLFAAGGYLGANALENFVRERDNPLSSNDYIHTKFMLVDPLGDDPLVITGSANFSRSSQRSNDENMLVIRGDTRVADIYVGEFFRIFDHHYARYVVRKMKDLDLSDPNAGFLKPKAKDWVPAHFAANNPKSKRRKHFSGGD